MKKLQESRKKLYRWLVVCAAGIMFWSLGITGWAARTGTVNVDGINVRSEASADSGRVCQLSSNTTVNIVDEAQGSDGNIWYSVTFTLDGAETAGWIRSDLLTVSETAEIAVGDGTGAAYSIQEPQEAYAASDSLTQTSITVGEGTFTAWQVNTELTGGAELYLVYAVKADGSGGWFYYDPQEGTFQRNMGQFAGTVGGEEPEGLIQALQNQLMELETDSKKQLSQRLYIIIGMAVLCVVLLVLLIVFILKYRDAAYEYFDDDDELGYDPNDFDDFVKDVRKKWQEEDRRGKQEPDEDEEEEAKDDEQDDELPKIDMSAVLAVEEEAEKVQKEQPEKKSRKTKQPKEQKKQDVKSEPAPAAEEDDDTEDFDIEIVDWADLDL